jgi:hypothetical protein
MILGTIQTDNWQMPLTDMIVNEHGDKAFAQYSNKIWTNDPISLLNCYYICWEIWKLNQFVSEKKLIFLIW